MKTVLINVTNTIPVRGIYGNYVSGIGQATKALVNAMNEMENIPYNIELYATGVQSLNFNYYGWKFKHHTLPIPLKGKIRRLLGRHPDSFLRPLLYKYDLFHITESYFDVSPKESFIVTIHDCTDMDKQFSEDVTESTRDALRRRYQKMADKSKMILTDSEYSKSEIVKYFKVSDEKVFVNYLGIDRNRFRQLPQEEIQNVKNKFGICKPFFFACSCNRPRKNLITALRAFKKFLTYNPDHIFVVAWDNPCLSIKKEFSNEIEEKKILFLPFVSDEEIVALYNAASLSVYVSRKEGFGMPILESFACGVPVMTCRNSSLVEVGQDAAIYVGEDSIDEMVDVMLIIEANKYDISRFNERTHLILNRFSWQNTVKRLLDVYETCI